MGEGMAKSDATIYEVAAAANVSIATVSRVINASSNVRPDTRQRVEAAMKQLKFVPSMAARGLSGGKSQTIGLAYPIYEERATFNTSFEEDVSVLYSDTIVRGASAQAAHRGYSLFTCTASPATKSGLLAIQQLSSTVDGLILADRVMSDAQAAQVAKRLPVVLLSGSGSPRFGAAVRADNEGGMAEMVAHLATQHGVRRFGYVDGVTESPDSIARLNSFRKAVATHKGKVLVRDVLVGAYSMMHAEVATAERLATGEGLPEVFVCANDQMAVGVMHTLRDHGVKVPTDILVTGFDDIPIARMVTPSLTTVRQSGFSLGVSAVDMVVGLLSGDVAKGTTQTLATELVLRGSCGCPEQAVRPLLRERAS
jgi:LacI family transcriptional regulator